MEKNFHGDKILEKEKLEDGLIKILVSVNGSEIEYHVSQEELDAAHVDEDSSLQDENMV